MTIHIIIKKDNMHKNSYMVNKISLLLNNMLYVHVGHINLALSTQFSLLNTQCTTLKK